MIEHCGEEKCWCRNPLSGRRSDKPKGTERYRSHNGMRYQIILIHRNNGPSEYNNF